MSTSPISADPVGLRRKRRAITVAAAVLAATVIRLVAELADAEMVTGFEGQEPMNVNLPLVISFSLLIGLAGWAAIALLERRTSKALTAWTVLAAVVLLLSFGPVSLTEATAGTRTTLAVIHIAVGVVLISGIRWSSSRTVGPLVNERLA